MSTDKSYPIEATTPVTEHDDGRFLRTALVLHPPSGGQGGSVDLLDENGERLAQVNCFVYDDGRLIVDVIDVERRYATRRMLHFDNGDRHVVEMGDGLVASVDFS